MFGGLGALWGGGSWGHISEQNGGLEDSRGRPGGSGGPGINFGSHFGALRGAKMRVKSNQKTEPTKQLPFSCDFDRPRGPNSEIS